jgi:dethiobiotin synthetase
VRGCFVTGTDTGAGKSVVAAAIVAALAARGLAVAARKPIITGLEESADPDWPHDHELLAAAAGCSPQEVVFAGYRPAVSPHLALELAGEQLRPGELRDTLRDAGEGAELLIVEGVGGLLVPLGEGYDVRQLAVDLGLPVVIAARPGLGTINHTLLTLEAARAVGLRIAGVVLTPWPANPGVIERSNRETIARLGRTEVSTLEHLAAGRPDLLAAAGEQLPLDSWVG